jgi:hypothetical protein
MTYTYSSALSTNLDKVRFLIGDTTETEDSLSDAEISGLLTMYPSVHRTAAAICDRKAMDFASRPDISIDGASFRYGDRAKMYQDLAKSIRASEKNAAGGFGSPFVGGISVSEIASEELDTDRQANVFPEPSFDNNGAE